MTEDPIDSSEIRETDIVFDCPHCSKSLAIDYRGAGLLIPCSDCGRHVQVPIPEGMEISDIDSTEEEQEARILNLRRALAAAERQIADLEDELQDVSERREALERARTEQSFRLGAAHEKMGVLNAAVRDLEDALQSVSKSSSAPAPSPSIDPDAG